MSLKEPDCRLASANILLDDFPKFLLDFMTVDMYYGIYHDNCLQIYRL